MLAAEFLHREVGVQCLLPQLFYTLLQPLAGSACRLVFGIELIDHVNVGNGGGDVSRQVRRLRGVADIENVGFAHAFDVDIARDRFCGRSPLRLRVRCDSRIIGKPGTKIHQRLQRRDRKERVFRCVEYRVVDQLQLVDNRIGDRIGLQQLDLAENRAFVIVQLAESGELIDDLIVAAVDQHARVGGINRHSCQDINDAENGKGESTSRNDPPLPASNGNQLVEIDEISFVSRIAGGVDTRRKFIWRQQFRSPTKASSAKIYRQIQLLCDGHALTRRLRRVG
ncbi:hypothetical protein RHECNPAF_4300100 [Rhizobium etli CNPAF512]|nr:hypothetical protein RHECNPAF_4300100 [Rhizobium etli CNPAF512]